ncbi:MAG: acyl-CoA reductase [Saprospiraceae bacterium]|nr:acyl-CoA reductase [Saprospiraceae bacterium]
MEQKLAALDQLRERLLNEYGDLAQIIVKAGQINPWFTPRQVRLAISNICSSMLEPSRLQQWITSYALPVSKPDRKKVGLVMAGNIPLVGFHDFLCVWLSGHHSLIKLSEKDALLLTWILTQLNGINPAFEGDWEIVDRLTGFDAVIATGSNNSARYFDAYFGAYPHIIRKNRNAVAVLNGTESSDQLALLAQDILTYFGLGCRNVSKLIVPAGYDFHPLLDIIDQYPELQEHNRYRNNVDYQYTLAIMNQEPHHTHGHLLIRPSASLLSPMATVYYEEYQDENQINVILDRDRDNIQCIVSDRQLPGIETIPFGNSQCPRLEDYADGVDVMAFLVQLHQDA